MSEQFSILLETIAALKPTDGRRVAAYARHYGAASRRYEEYWALPQKTRRIYLWAALQIPNNAL